MARYLEIGTEIAHRVRSGELPAGTELPAICEAARRHATTFSTIGRAYRYLASGGVITLADRRRAKVATDATIAAARLLEADRVFRLAGLDEQTGQLTADEDGGPRRLVISSDFYAVYSSAGKKAEGLVNPYYWGARPPALRAGRRREPV